MTSDPPLISGVRRSFVVANGVRFHVTEAGPPDGRPVLALHGWPQHHWEYRDLLGDPPPGLRIIAPDLPGYGWSGPAPHKWAKQDVATDVLALLDALGLDRVLLVAHDWGAAAGWLMVLQAPERFDGYLAMNINHPWQSPRSVSVTRCARGQAGIHIEHFCCVNCRLRQGNPKGDGRRCRYACCSVSATWSSVRLWCHPKPPMPMTTRWKPSTPRTSSSTNGQTWCAGS
jgi:pimeloyl-ACP methyl ester carboxylesterase